MSEALRLADAIDPLIRNRLDNLTCATAAAELRRLHELEKQYHELLYAVGNKYEGESRHQTALRYIEQAEIVDVVAAKESA